MGKSKHNFFADRPINSTEEDLLNRKGFALDLADTLANWHGQESLVVSLNGDWGSGKTSIKNMIVSSLKKKTHAPNIIEFSPWEWAGQEKITTAFFKEMALQIGLEDKSENGKKLSRLFKKYGIYLNTGEIIFSGFAKAIPALFIIVSLMGLLPYATNHPSIIFLSKVLIGISIAWAGVLKWGKSLLDSISGSYIRSSSELALSLDEIRNSLIQGLKERKNSLLIVMDDIDRLSKEQLRIVIQLVKANSEFPNVVFLLLFQRDIIEQKLTEGNVSGRDYLEKIIQVPFTVPAIEKSKIHNVLFNSLNKIIEQNASATEMLDEDYFYRLFYHSFQYYFKHLRDVYRFISTFSFHFTLFKGNKSFEVNPADLIAIEVIRTFEPEVYECIAHSYDLFTQPNSPSSKHEKEAFQMRVKEILKKASENNRDKLEVLLSEMFPNLAWALNESFSIATNHEAWIRDTRICAPSCFKKYFQFCIPHGELSNSDLKEMLESTADCDKFIGFVESLKKRNIFSSGLRQFLAFAEKVPTENAEAYLQALMVIAENSSKHMPGFHETSDFIQVFRLAYWFLEKRKESVGREKLLLDCHKKTETFSLLQRFIELAESKISKNEELFVSESGIRKLKTNLLKKVNELMKSRPESLLVHSNLNKILSVLKENMDAKKLSDWVENQIRKENNVILFLKSFISKTVTVSMDRYLQQENFHLKLSMVEKFVEIPLIKECLSQIKHGDPDESDREVIHLFEEALNKRELGIDAEDEIH